MMRKISPASQEQGSQTADSDGLVPEVVDPTIFASTYLIRNSLKKRPDALSAITPIEFDKDQASVATTATSTDDELYDTDMEEQSQDSTSGLLSRSSNSPNSSAPSTVSSPEMGPLSEAAYFPLGNSLSAPARLSSAYGMTSQLSQQAINKINIDREQVYLLERLKKELRDDNNLYIASSSEEKDSKESKDSCELPPGLKRSFTSEDNVNSVLMEYIPHIMIEAIGIISWAMRKPEDSKRFVGIFYKSDTNKTAAAIGRLLINLPGIFPKQLAFLKGYGNKAPLPLYLDDLTNHNSDRPFEFQGAKIITTVCYSAKDTSHCIGGDNIFNAGNYFASKGVTELVTFMPRDGGSPENIEKRAKWLAKNQSYIDQLAKKVGDKSLVRVQHHAELIQEEFHKSAETLFVTSLMSEHSVRAAIIADVRERLVSKGYIFSKSPKLEAILVPRNGSMSPAPVLTSPHNSPKKERRNGSKSLMTYSKPKALSFDEKDQDNKPIKQITAGIVRSVVNEELSTKQLVQMSIFAVHLERATNQIQSDITSYFPENDNDSNSNSSLTTKNTSILIATRNSSGEMTVAQEKSHSTQLVIR